MSRYITGLINIISWNIKILLLKIIHGSNLNVTKHGFVSPNTNIVMQKGTKLRVGDKINLKSNCELLLRKKANVTIGNNVFMNKGCMVVSWDKVTIGDNVQFGPGVLVYDQDHDYRAKGGLASEEYKTSPVNIGNNVWIGANCIILRGVNIEDNCVIAAGTVVHRGVYPNNSIIYNGKKILTIKYID